MSNKLIFVSALIAALSFLMQPGVAQDSPLFHQGPWPIHHGFNHQPTGNQLRALNHQDVTPDAARVIDRLYDQLTSDSEKILGNIPHPDIDNTRIDISSKHQLSSRVPGLTRSLTQSQRTAPTHDYAPEGAPVTASRSGRPRWSLGRQSQTPAPNEDCLWGLKRYNGVFCP
jgi:hypothetical protein